MKKEKKELVRVQSIIESDRLSAGDNFEELITIDLHKVLTDYFDYRGTPSIKISKSGNKLNVDISLVAESIKPFGVVPK